jgi:hypothetical protein
MGGELTPPPYPPPLPPPPLACLHRRPRAQRTGTQTPSPHYPLRRPIGPKSAAGTRALRPPPPRPNPPPTKGGAYSKAQEQPHHTKTAKTAAPIHGRTHSPAGDKRTRQTPKNQPRSQQGKPEHDTETHFITCKPKTQHLARGPQCRQPPRKAAATGRIKSDATSATVTHPI